MQERGKERKKERKKVEGGNDRAGDREGEERREWGHLSLLLIGYQAAHSLRPIYSSGSSVTSLSISSKPPSLGVLLQQQCPSQNNPYIYTICIS